LEAVPVGASLSGPAIVESDFTSIVIEPGATARRDISGNLVIEIAN
jgi:N-methylhydantoinase A